MPQLYQIKSEVWLNRHDECYKNIITISPPPKDKSLKMVTKLYNRERLSPFQERSPCCPQNNCMYVVMDPNDKCEMLCVDQLDVLFSYLLENNFTFNTDLTKMMFQSRVQIKNLIAFISK